LLTGKKRAGCWALLIALLVGVVALATSPGRTAVDAAFLVLDILPTAPISPLRLTTRQPIYKQVSYPAGEARNVAELYRPADDGRHSAIIFALGFYPDYTEAPLAGLAEALAREGVVVMMPHSASLEAGQLTPGEIDSLIAAFEYLHQRDYVDTDHVGFVGFCVGSSFATMAASDERIAGEVAFLHLFSGYFNLASVIRAITTKTMVEAGTTQPWEPSELVSTVLTQHLVEGVENPADRAALGQLLTEGVPSPAGADHLSPQAQAVYALLTNRDPSKVSALLDRLPRKQRQALRQMSPAYRAGPVRARVFVMGDAGDTYIPPAETRRLAESLARETEVEYVEFVLFEHVRPTRTLGRLSFLWDAGRLLVHLYKVLAVVER